MKSQDIAHLRLHNQHITDIAITNPRDVVRSLGAVQAQDYLGALWAVGLRTQNAVEKDIEQAIAERTIIRTWPMRGTLHFVTAEDVKWMLQLLTPRVLASSAYRRQQLEINDQLLARSKELFINALEGGKQLSRNAMYQVLEEADISTSGQRGIHVLGHLAQEGLICFGTREGKQPTFALLDEWAPNAQSMERDIALAELTRRYYSGHGPATVHDFMWWSGLTATDANAGLAMVKAQLVHETIDGKAYWMTDTIPTKNSSSLFLLPGFDEYLLGYKDRSAVLSSMFKQFVNPGNNGMFSPTIVIDGQVVGTWRRTFKKGGVAITSSLFAAPDVIDREAFASAARRYGEFLDMPVSLS